MRVGLPVLIAMFLCSGCDSQRAATPPKPTRDAMPTPKVTSFGMAQFSYITRDEAGMPLTKGMLIIPWPVSSGTTFSGTWQASYFSNDDMPPTSKLGPQVGGGACRGDMSGSELRLALNPSVNDNNVTFIVRIDGQKLAGRWEYSNFTGLANRGTLEATMER